MGTRDSRVDAYVERAADSARLTAVADLPSKAVLVRYVKKAMDLYDRGVEVVRNENGPKPALRTPKALAAALARDAKARATWKAFRPSHRRDYVGWIPEAKGADTRQGRLDTTMAWLAEGKSRNGKYERC